MSCWDLAAADVDGELIVSHAYMTMAERDISREQLDVISMG